MGISLKNLAIGAAIALVLITAEMQCARAAITSAKTLGHWTEFANCAMARK